MARMLEARRSPAFCPGCGAERLTNAAGPCWQCDYPLESLGLPLPGPSPQALAALAATPQHSLPLASLGLAYHAAVLFAVALVSELPWLVLLLIAGAAFPLWKTLRIARLRDHAGIPFTPRGWLLTLLVYQGMIATTLLLLLAALQAFGCFLCLFWAFGILR